MDRVQIKMERKGKCLAVLALALATFISLTLVEADGTTSKRELKRHEVELAQLCRKIGTFKKISQMEELITVLERVLKEKTFDAYRNQLNQAGNSLKYLIQSPMVACLQQADAITDLAEIIREKKNVCSSKHIDLIEQYHERHVKKYQNLNSEQASGTFSRLASVIGPNNKLLTGKFFEIYANQVSFICKSNLLLSLKKIDSSKMISEDIYSKAMPWVSETNSKICKKIEQQERLAAKLEFKQQQVFATESKDFTHQEVQQCRAGKAIAEISTLDELVEAFGGISEQHGNETQANQGADSSLEKSVFEEIEQAKSDAQPENAESSGSSGDETSDKSDKSALFLLVPPDQTDIVKDMLYGCSKLQPIYDQIVMPIVRLAKLNYNPTFANFDRICAEDKLIQKWFGITLVCSSMLISHLPNVDKYKELEERVEAEKRSLVIVDEEQVQDEAANDANFAPAKNTMSKRLSKLFSNPIEDELWVYKYTSTSKLQRLKESLLKKVFKLFKVEDIDDHIVFRKRVSGVNHWIVRVVILTISVLILKR